MRKLKFYEHYSILGSFTARRKDSLVDIYYDQLTAGVYGIDSLIGTSMVSIPVTSTG